MDIIPYLNFNGDCAEAFALYEKLMDGKIIFSSKWGDSPMADQMPEMKDKLMHISMQIGNTVLMGSDTGAYYTGRLLGRHKLAPSVSPGKTWEGAFGGMDEIVALIALYRPGPMEWIPDYVRGKKDPETVKFPHPLLEEVCRETYGIMVYQEQVMEAAKVIAGLRTILGPVAGSSGLRRPDRPTTRRTTG